ncbi:hypothetical protein PROPEN_02932 [Proteus penneri ATCC 35198]|nr:hypothetical protein PROPEN_02932 [Proteus penneri ATCC 35198]
MTKPDPLSLFKKQIDNLAETMAPIANKKNCSTLLRHSTVPPPK